MAQGTLKYRVTFFIAVLSSALLFGWLGSLAADRELPTVIYSAEAATPIVENGGELRIEYVVRRTRSCSVSVDRFIIDNQKTRFELDDIVVRGGLPLGEDHFFQPVKVPLDASKGPAVYRTISTYMCNPLQYIWPIAGGVKDIVFIVR